jgi:hypothetical protein
MKNNESVFNFKFKPTDLSQDFAGSVTGFGFDSKFFTAKSDSKAKSRRNFVVGKSSPRSDTK